MQKPDPEAENYSLQHNELSRLVGVTVSMGTCMVQRKLEREVGAKMKNGGCHVTGAFIPV